MFSGCFENVAYQLIADLDIVEALETNATFISLLDFSHIFFPNAQGSHVTFVDQIGPAEETHFRVTTQFTIGYSASRHFTKLGRGEYCQHLRATNDAAWVNDSDDASAGADRFLWNKPFIPMVNTSTAAVPQWDRRSMSMYGVRRNYIGADYIWRLSDTTAVLSDMNFDMQSGVVQQFDIGFSHMRWPDLSYYVGSRYLRRITIMDPSPPHTKLQEGSNAFVFAITYVLDPRYTVVFSQQIDFDYGTTIGSEITLLRQYHRMYWGLTYSVDESLDEQTIMFSIWPQGVSDLGIGGSRYRRIGGSAVDY